MESIYKSPSRVYLILGILSVIGIWSAWKLPVSLFPNSSKPTATICMNIDLAPAAFLQSYGYDIEGQLSNIRRGNLEIEKLVANYNPKDVCYQLEFKWGGDPDEALREVQTTVAGFSARLPESTRDRISVYTDREGGGFLALMFYSQERSLNEVYQLLEPVLAPKLALLEDSKDAFLFNPQKREVQIQLKPEALASAGLVPNQVAYAVVRALDSYGGGSLTKDAGTLRIEFPSAVGSIDDVHRIQVPTPAGRSVALGEIATIDLAVPMDSARSFKVSGVSSVMLWASPKPGGNVKAMAEQILRIIHETLPTLPKDIQYKTLVDPSEFIRSAVNNVAKEVAVAAGLAVIILFLFVGNLRNVATAAIEIPLSLVLAFILMRISGMNLNLISLGGLALSAGMNVDASVVVMENIFRHLEEKKALAHTLEGRVRIIVDAVKEVQFAVIASTIASLVVFLPLAFTSALSYAILGDLAKAVVFSHGFSAIVALILVPTIRLHLMRKGMPHESPGLFERPLQAVERAYGRALKSFLERPKWKIASYVALAALFGVLIAFVAPRLPREVIGKPDTDWVVMGINTNGNTSTSTLR